MSSASFFGDVSSSHCSGLLLAMALLSTSGGRNAEAFMQFLCLSMTAEAMQMSSSNRIERAPSPKAHAAPVCRLLGGGGRSYRWLHPPPARQSDDGGVDIIGGRADDCRCLGFEVLDIYVIDCDGMLQLLLPSPRAHLDNLRSAELGDSWRVSDHGDHRQPVV